MDTGEDGEEIAAADDDPHTGIARLEERIEALSEALERCRKVRLVSQIALAAGAAWFVGAALGLFAFDPIGLVGAIAAVIGGIVAYGSNTTTTRETAAALKDAETRRANLISLLDLRVVGEPDRVPRRH